jgi:hypothetical protein
MVGILSLARAVTTLPQSDALLVENVLSNAVAVPLSDARPSEIHLVWHSENENPLITGLVAAAEELSA